MKNRIVHNIGFKLLSVLLALLLWLTVMNVEDPTVTETISDIPVLIVNDEVIKSRGYGYTIESGEKVDIRVKGRRSVVNNLAVEDFVATADFSSVSSMKMVPIEVTCKDEHASDLTWTLKTESMAILLESELQEYKSIRIDRIGDVKEGYYLYNLAVDASLVNVSGAQSQVENVKELVAEVNLEGVKDSGTLEVELYAVDFEGQKIDSKKVSLDPEITTAKYEIYPIKNVPLSVETTGSPQQYFYLGETEYAPKEIQITATEEKLNNIEEFKVDVDVTGAVSDIESKIDLEEYIEEKYPDLGIKLVDQTKTMGIKIPVIAMTEQSLELKEDIIELVGADETKYKYTVNTGIASRIMVRGKAEEMTNIEASDFGLYIDVTGLIPQDKYTVQVLSRYEGNLIVQTGTVDLTIESISEEEPSVTPDVNEGNQ